MKITIQKLPRTVVSKILVLAFVFMPSTLMAQQSGVSRDADQPKKAEQKRPQQRSGRNSDGDAVDYDHPATQEKKVAEPRGQAQASRPDTAQPADAAAPARTRDDYRKPPATTAAPPPDPSINENTRHGNGR